MFLGILEVVIGIGQEQVRDIKRASKPGMIWVEFTDSVPSIEFVNTDTVKVRIKKGSGFVDARGGNGTRDVVIQNGTVGSRATFVSVNTGEPWISFRVIRDSSDLKRKRTQLDTILFIDNGILGTDSCLTPYGDSTKAMSPISLRIVCDEKMTSSMVGRFKGKIYFSSSSTEPALVALPVEFIIDDASTSVDEGANVNRECPLIRVSPNPSRDACDVTIRSSGTTEFLVFSPDGRLEYSYRFVGNFDNEETFPVNELPSGVHSVVVRDQRGVAVTRLIVLK